MVAKRARTLLGGSSSSSRQYDPALQLPHWPAIKIATPEQKENLEQLYGREVIPSRWLHRPTLEALGLYDYVRRFFNDIGMRKFVEMHYATYRELTCEFLSSLHVHNHKTGLKLIFKLNNRNITLTFVDFCKLFDLESDLPHQWHAEYKMDDIYTALNGLSAPYAQHASVKPIHHPVPKIWQRFAGVSFLGRNEPHNCQTNEPAVVGHYVFGFGKLNIARYIIHHLARHATASNAASIPIRLGGLITRIAIKKADFVETRPN